MTHLTFDQLSELAELPERHEADADAARHVAGCGECRETLVRIRRLLAAVHELPREVEAPPEVWSALRERVARDRVLAGGRRSRWWHNGWLASAAVIILVL